jgi:ribonuclease HI
MFKKRLTVYTDGSCSPNPGRGGWGFIAIEEDADVYISGGEKKTTNNIMELTAVIEPLKMYSHYKKFHFYSDSLYVINCATGKWGRHKNKQYWAEYDKVSKGKNIKFTWVKGHNGDEYNELVDKLAKSEVFT